MNDCATHYLMIMIVQSFLYIKNLGLIKKLCFTNG